MASVMRPDPNDMPEVTLVLCREEAWEYLCDEETNEQWWVNKKTGQRRPYDPEWYMG